jgi:riboflavin kinase/FMN adenylyltransferase
VSIGFFDGAHRGHQSIIHTAVKRARDDGLRSVVVTFDRHPMEVVRPGSQPPLLMTAERRAHSLANLGADLVVLLPFDDDLRHSKPDAFVDRVLMGPVSAQAVIVGTNFRFGHRAAGDVATLAELGAGRGFEAVGVTLLEVDGVTVSSTEIRGAIAAGDVRRAAQFLGRPHLLDGIVVRGERRGAGLGFPTANLAIPDRLAIPANGVYAGLFHLPDGRTFPSVTNVGERPTFSGRDVRVEAHLIDTDEDLYGISAGVDFRHRLRGEQRFSGPDELVTQIRRDVDEARRLLDS